MTIVEITSNEQFNEFLISLQTQNSKYLISYFYCDNCSQCKYLAKPTIEKLYEKYKDNKLFNFVQMDTSKANLKETSFKCNINYVPVLIIFELENQKIKCDMMIGKNISSADSKIENLLSK